MKYQQPKIVKITKENVAHGWTMICNVGANVYSDPYLDCTSGFSDFYDCVGGAVAGGGTCSAGDNVYQA